MFLKKIVFHWILFATQINQIEQELELLKKKYGDQIGHETMQMITMQSNCKSIIIPKLKKKQAQMSEDPRPLNDDVIKTNMTSL